jgi:alpha-ketoglutarate-dependent taurine dioxygenase
MSADVVTTPLSPFGVLVRPAAGAPPIESVPVARLREALDRDRLVVLRGFAPLREKRQLADYARRWGELLEWDFGAVFEVVEHADPKNYLFTSGSVPYHWDGAFAKQTPWLQVFHCLESPGDGRGGETLFCDTTRVWLDAPREQRKLWERVEVEYFTEKVAHYGGQVRAALVDVHPLTGGTTLRFAEPANAATVKLNTPELKVHGVGETEAPALLDRLVKLLYSPKYVYAHAWRAGDYVIADNHALLHGRTPYRGGLPRRLWRVHVL